MVCRQKGFRKEGKEMGLGENGGEGHAVGGNGWRDMRRRGGQSGRGKGWRRGLSR